MKKNSRTILNKSIIKYILSIIIIVFAFLILIYSKNISIDIINSINSCLNTIIPSLFAFMVISNILIKSNIYILISKPFYLISKYLFKIQPELFSIFLLSNIGGFPIGAKLLSELRKENKITQNDANTMICYCYCSGPAFIIGTIGIQIFNSVLVGFLIFMSIFISNFIIGIILGIKRKVPIIKKQGKRNINLNSNILIDSIESTVQSLTLICGTIIFFAAIISLLNNIGFISKIAKIITVLLHSSSNYTTVLVKSFFEISTISQLQQYCYKIIPIITALLSLGGLCVLIQISGISKGNLNLKKFIITRPLQIIFSSILSYYFIQSFSKEIVIMTILKPTIQINKSLPILPSILLIFMVILLLLEKNSRFFKKNMIYLLK